MVTAGTPALGDDNDFEATGAGGGGAVTTCVRA